MVELVSGPKTRELAAYDAIRAAILAGHWKPGDSVTVSKVAADIGISRVPVTNAIKRLASEGFIRQRPHHEAQIAPLDPADIREIYLMRASLTALAGEEAATRVMSDDIEDIHAQNEALRQVVATDPSNLPQIRAMDRAFHRRIETSSAMPRISQLLENLADQCEYYRALLLDESHLAAPSADRHEPIISAVKSRDAAVAGTLLRAHVVEGMRIVLSALGESE